MAERPAALRITGGRKLRGKITVSGSKNSALPCLFASLLTDGQCQWRRVPRLSDVETALAILQRLGKSIDWRAGTLSAGKAARSGTLNPDQARSMRASILALGPLLAIGKKVILPLPGGCDIGSRPIAVHLAGLEKLGVTICISGGFVKAAPPKRLRAAHIVLDAPSVTGTENLIMAATLARGNTVIENCACEPEIVDLSRMLEAMGARIEGAGTATVTIEGVTALGGCRHLIMADRIEAGTYLAAVAAAGGSVELLKADASVLGAFLAKLEEMGVAIEAKPGSIRAKASGRPIATGFETAPYPGFPTDLQAQLMAVNCIARGKAAIVERIFERRFRHADELALLGADIRLRGNQALVTGAAKLQGARTEATDLRASASLVIAALAASGDTVIGGLHHLERGYEQLPRKLRSIGAQIRRVRLPYC
ncbi:MAG: UDP-N-acetylglucosamine 1-carboxyvinyltransferase [Betaproteobacteria bacterium]|nr:UDP-N-acetylglucosamine 1-carboxyvinyltransferase [Betaproteobacteria bacterium]